MSSDSWWRWIAGLAVILYLGLSTAALLTREPWCDEAWFNAPALNLETRGYMGTPYLDPASNIGKAAVRLDGVDRYTYWMTPLYMVVQAGWFKVAGFGLMRARLTALIWGLVALVAWWAISHKLAGPLAASLAILLIGVDYQFVVRATSGRMDTMCVALGAGGLAAYLALRERTFLRALLLANTAIAAAVVTHPIAVVYGVALAVAAFRLDRKRLRWRQLPLCAIPYAVAFSGWGWYIAKAPQLFRLQFMGNATRRGPGPLQPWAALKLEMWHRYGENFGMAPWSSPMGRAKILILAVYLAGLIYVAASRELRARAGPRLVLLLSCAVLAFFWLFEGTKSNLYLPHILPWFCLLAAIAAAHLGTTGRVPRWLLALALAGVVLIQSSSTLLPAWRNAYRRQFLPAMQFLQQHSQPDDTIMSDAVAGFVLGFDRNLVDDAWFGYRTGKKADWLVITPTYDETMESLAQQHSDVSRHVKQLLAEYRPVYSNKMYRICVRKRSVAALREF
ncbi:MAG TPA: glycosyltransferase family 39 protein [Candidatus Acidoferrales bacterium]|nr:glycosyltransferase family 39 protein [Candidatus Acidoferrales bacterium]